jgi:hypothetical protein
MSTVLTTTYDSTTNTNAVPINLAGLPTDALMANGNQSTVIDNTSNQFVDMQLMGQIQTGTTPTASRTVAVYVFAPTKIVSSVVSWPAAGSGTFGNANAAVTLDVEQLSALKLAWATSTNATSNRSYSFEVSSVAALFGGTMPPWVGVHVTHNTGVNFNANASQHWIHYTGIKYTNT